VECFCCGEDRDESTVVSLLCHDEIKVCRMCVGWLFRRGGGMDVTPTLPVADMPGSIRFFLTDPSGNSIRVGQNITTDET
jgi:hypothetical protein